jgi:hypothetical protein
MAFDLHITIREDSREAQVILQVANDEHITRDEAAERLLFEGVRSHGKPTPSQEMWGALSGDQDVALLDEIVSEAYALRIADQPRDFGI